MARGHNSGGSLHPSFSRRVATTTTSPTDQIPSAFEALALFVTGHIFFTGNSILLMCMNISKKDNYTVEKLATNAVSGL